MLPAPPQGGSQSFPMVKCREGSPRDDPSRFTRNLALAATALQLPQFSHRIPKRFSLLIYIQHEPFQAKCWLKCLLVFCN